MQKIKRKKMTKLQTLKDMTDDWCRVYELREEAQKWINKIDGFKTSDDKGNWLEKTFGVKTGCWESRCTPCLDENIYGDVVKAVLKHLFNLEDE